LDEKSSSSSAAFHSSRISTIILRGGTQALIDDVERVCIDAVNTYKVIFIFIFHVFLAFLI
jgi:hypothetical protein